MLAYVYNGNVSDAINSQMFYDASWILQMIASSITLETHMNNALTPIEILANNLDKHNVAQMDVLIPEQCMLIEINGKMYSVTIEEVE